jgi:hypothetical protein
MAARRPGPNSMVPIAAALPTLNTLTIPVFTRIRLLQTPPDR